jgi:hypothetical protein
VSQNPIFDATLDQYPHIWEASNIFPQPGVESLEQALARIGHPQYAKGGLIPKTDYTDWKLLHPFAPNKSDWTLKA